MHQVKDIQTVSMHPFRTGAAPSRSGSYSIQHQGKDYLVIPADEYHNRRINRQWLLGLGIAGILSAGMVTTAVIMRPETIVTVTEKPVIVERQVIVPTKDRCIAFCGNN